MIDKANKNVNIKNAKYIANGGLILDCGSGEDFESVVRALKTDIELDADCETEIPENYNLWYR